MGGCVVTHSVKRSRGNILAYCEHKMHKIDSENCLFIHSNGKKEKIFDHYLSEGGSKFDHFWPPSVVHVAKIERLYQRYRAKRASLNLRRETLITELLVAKEAAYNKRSYVVKDPSAPYIYWDYNEKEVQNTELGMRIFKFESYMRTYWHRCNFLSLILDRAIKHKIASDESNKFEHNTFGLCHKKLQSKDQVYRIKINGNEYWYREVPDQHVTVLQKLNWSDNPIKEIVV